MLTTQQLSAKWGFFTALNCNLLVSPLQIRDVPSHWHWTRFKKIFKIFFFICCCKLWGLYWTFSIEIKISEDLVSFFFFIICCLHQRIHQIIFIWTEKGGTWIPRSSPCNHQQNLKVVNPLNCLVIQQHKQKPTEFQEDGLKQGCLVELL